MMGKSAPKSFRSGNDEKIMANSQSAPGGPTNRKIEADMTTINSTENSPIEAYYSFPQSNSKQSETYSTRMEKLSTALGNRDEVKG